VKHIEQVHGTYYATISTHDTWRIIIGCRVTSPEKSIGELHHIIFLLKIALIDVTLHDLLHLLFLQAFQLLRNLLFLKHFK